MSSAIKEGTEEIVEVTRVVGNKSAKVVNIDLDPLTYAEVMSCLTELSGEQLVLKK